MFLIRILILQPLDDISNSERPIGEDALHVLIVHQVWLIVVRLPVRLKLLVLKGLIECLRWISLFLNDRREKIDLLQFILAVKAIRLDKSGSILCASLLVMRNQIALVEQLKSVIVEMKHRGGCNLLSL